MRRYNVARNGPKLSGIQDGIKLRRPYATAKTRRGDTFANGRLCDRLHAPDTLPKLNSRNFRSDMYISRSNRDLSRSRWSSIDRIDHRQVDETNQSLIIPIEKSKFRKLNHEQFNSFNIFNDKIIGLFG